MAILRRPTTKKGASVLASMPSRLRRERPTSPLTTRGRPSSRMRPCPTAPKGIEDAVDGLDDKDDISTFFRFDSILEADSTQDMVYSSMGSSMIHHAMKAMVQQTECSNEKEHEESRDHVVVSLGISNSGKTHTIFGPTNTTTEVLVGNQQEEGLVPRLLHGIFEKFQRCAKVEDGLNSAVQLSMVYVRNDKVYDMLSSFNDKINIADKNKGPQRNARRIDSSGVRKMVASFERSGAHSVSVPSAASRILKSSGEGCMKEIKIHLDGKSKNFFTSPHLVTCTSAASAHRALHFGLDQAVTSSTGINLQSSRGHTIVSLCPVVVNGNDVVLSGRKITIVDTAGIERTRRSRVSGAALRESAAINASVHGVLQCLRCIKHNNTRGSDSGNLTWNKIDKENKMVVPYRQEKLTMLLQPLFSGTNTATTTQITLLVSAYPGENDYAEKKALLGEIDSLRGLVVSANTPNQVQLPVTPQYSPQTLPKPCNSLTVKERDASASKGAKGWIKGSPLKRLSTAVASSAAKKVKGTRPPTAEEENGGLIQRMAFLEEERAGLLKENQLLRGKCHELTYKNKDLIELLKKNPKKEEKEERMRVAERDERIRLQNSLGVDLQDHMKHIDQSNEDGPCSIKWQVARQKPFLLQMPEKDLWTCSSYYQNQAKEVSKNVLQTMAEAVSKNQSTQQVDIRHHQQSSMDDLVNITKEGQKSTRKEMTKVFDFEF